MKQPESLEALIKLIEHTDADDRRLALRLWIDHYVAHLSESQLTMAPRELALEHHDFICHKIVHDCVDNMIDKKLVRFTVEDHKYTADMWALKSYRHIKDFKK